MLRLIVVVLILAATAPAAGASMTSDFAQLVAVEFSIPGEPLRVTVFTDGRWENWRQWPIRANRRLSREGACQYRIDASRVLRGLAVTVGLPRRCMDQWTRRQRPDPHPSARRSR